MALSSNRRASRPRDVDDGLVAQVEVAHHLSDGRSHQETMSGEAGGVQESGHLGGLTHQCVVVGGHLVESGPPAGDADLGDLRGPALDRLAEPRQPVVGPAELEAGSLVGVGHAEQQAPALAVEVEAGGEVDRERRVRVQAAASARSSGSAGAAARPGGRRPTMSPSCLDQAPAAQMTVSVLMVPRLVSTAVMVAPSVDDAGDRDSPGPGGRRHVGRPRHTRGRRTPGCSARPSATRPRPAARRCRSAARAAWPRRRRSSGWSRRARSAARRSARTPRRGRAGRAGTGSRPGAGRSPGRTPA